MTLVEFLTARLGELAALAQAATPGPWDYDGNPSAVVVTADEGRSLAASAYNWSDPVCAANARHIATHDPAYVLADIALLVVAMFLAIFIAPIPLSWVAGKVIIWRAKRREGKP